MTENAAATDKPKLEADVAPFRAPMVTSVGFILGFMLAFLANWAAQATDAAPAVETGADWLVVLTLGMSILLLVVVLYRMLDNASHKRPAERYRSTLRLYMGGIAIAFIGLAAALVL